MSAPAAPDLRHLVADLVLVLREIADDIGFLVGDERTTVEDMAEHPAMRLLTEMLGEVERARHLLELCEKDRSESPSESGATS
jgi:hypothetical protein